MNILNYGDKLKILRGDRGRVRRCLLTVLFTFLVSLLVTAQTASGQQKVIKDRAEYNTYMAAYNLTDPVQKAAAMEAFVAQYPNSVVKIDGMQFAMAAYQQAGNTAKVSEAANRLLQFDPENVRALAIAAYLRRAEGNAKEAGVLAERGLKALLNWPSPMKFRTLTSKSFPIK